MVVLFGTSSKCTMASPQCTAKCRLPKVIYYTFSLVSYVKSALAAVRDPCVKAVYHDCGVICAHNSNENSYGELFRHL